mmetsp:Transcript_36075/g.107891  ORF Transcript_36075/g.107891 Transcript_36075/m.107891 type:complete len:97 (-) Transcript_36075:215-505(-)
MVGQPMRGLDSKWWREAKLVRLEGLDETQEDCTEEKRRRNGERHDDESNMRGAANKGSGSLHRRVQWRVEKVDGMVGQKIKVGDTEDFRGLLDQLA